jgi:T5SS/PEP-CTERM-associated repeat protein
VGYNGVGELSVTAGGHVSDGNSYIGRNVGASGTVTVDGSTWTNNIYLYVGNGGSGVLHITGGGQVSDDGGYIRSNSTVTIDGLNSKWTNNGSLYIDSGSLTFSSHALVLVADEMIVGPLGEVHGSGVIEGPQVRNGGLVSPGDSVSTGELIIVGYYTQTAAGKLLIELAGTTAASQYDQLWIGSGATLGGSLEVRLLDGFSPSAGQSFNILLKSHPSGAFDSIQLPALGGNLSWDTSQLYVSGVLSVVSAGLPGDYNGNGVVDTADYVVWRKNQGTTHTLPNDPIGGTIGTAQYDQWRTHFGQPLGSGAALPSAESLSTVPEPATAVMLVIAGAGWCLPRRRQHRKFHQPSTP